MEYKSVLYRESSVTRTDWVIAAGVTAFALILYTITLCPFAYPIRSAGLLAEQLGLTPFRPMTNYLWGALTRLTALIPIGSLEVRQNFLSAIWGALSAGLFYLIMSRVNYNRGLEEPRWLTAADTAGRLCGVVSALTLIVSTPFWLVSTRAFPATFHIFLLLVAIWLLMRYQEEQTDGLLYAFSLLCGVGITEFATFIVFLPILGGAAVILMWQAGMLRARTLIQMALLWLVGASLYFFSAWRYTLSPAFEWRQFTGFWQVLWFIWREQYMALSRSVPRVGWMVVLLVSIVPWVLTVAWYSQGTERHVRWGVFGLRIVLTALSFLILFDFPLAPWRMLGFRSLLVTPYVIFASWSGYLAGYWYLAAGGSATRRSGSARGASLASRIVITLWLIGLSASAVWAFPLTNGRSGAAVGVFVKDAVRSLEGRKWIVAGGFLDDSLRVAIAEEGRGIRQLDPGMGRNSAYLNYLATLFEEPRLKGLAQVGLEPLLVDWLKNAPDAGNDLAIFVFPDLWRFCGYEPVPYRTLYVGARDLSALDADRLLADNLECWKRYEGIAAKGSPRDPMFLARRWIADHLSKLANNCGVLLEDMQRPDLAFTAYQESRTLNTNNISALLNIVAVAQAQSRPETADLLAEFEVFVANWDRARPVWSLSMQYGYVRNPEVFARQGLAWAMSGKPQMAVHEIERAIELGGGKQLNAVLAAMYAAQDKRVESGALYEQMLVEDPDNVDALLGLSRIAVRNGNMAAAGEYLDRLKHLAGNKPVVQVEEVIHKMIKGRLAEAERQLHDITGRYPRYAKAWVLLGFIAHQQGNEDGLEKAVTALRPLADDSPETRAQLSELYLLQGKPREAREQLLRAHRSAPSSIPILEQLLQLDYLIRDRDSAEQHVELILTLDPKNAVANLILGSIQVAREQYALAEASYRASIETRRTDTALNDLAWLLVRNGRYDEALPLVNEALTLNANNAPAWDTKGNVLFHLGLLDDAEKAFQRALELDPNRPEIVYHMAKLYHAKGMKSDALRIADPLLDKAAKLDRALYENVRTFVNDLRAP